MTHTISDEEDNMLFEKSSDYIVEDINKIKENLYNIFFDELHKFKWAWENGLFNCWDGMDDFVIRDKIFITFKIESNFANGIKSCVFESFRSQFRILNNIGADYETVKSNFETIIENAIDTIGISRYPSLYHDYVDNDVFPKFKASYIIQKQWKESISNPSYKICKDRLKREYDNM